MIRIHRRGASAHRPSTGWALIFDATGDAQLARDWGADLGDELTGPRAGTTLAMSAGEVLRWLDLSPPPLARPMGDA